MEGFTDRNKEQKLDKVNLQRQQCREEQFGVMKMEIMDPLQDYWFIRKILLDNISENELVI